MIKLKCFLGCRTSMMPLESRISHLNYAIEHANGAIPYTFTIGSGNQTHAFVVGATHGNEPAGVEALVRYHVHLTQLKAPIRGKITFLIGNPGGYRHNVRYCEEDLNRAFGKEKPKATAERATIERRRAQEITQLLTEARGDRRVLLDLHSVSKGNFKMAAYSSDNSRNRQLALAVSPLPLHFSYHANHLQGLIADEASRLGFEALGIECGNHESVDSADTAVEHMNGVFQHYALLPAEMLLPTSTMAKREPHRVYETIARITPGSDFRFLDERIVSEWPLKKGEAFAWDSEHGTHQAPADCYVMMPSKTTKPTDTDAGFLCIREHRDDFL